MTREKERLLNTLKLLGGTLSDIKAYVEQGNIEDLEFEISDLYEGVMQLTMEAALFINKERENE